VVDVGGFESLVAEKMMVEQLVFGVEVVQLAEQQQPGSVLEQVQPVPQAGKLGDPG
jgi:hypothetical protein